MLEIVYLFCTCDYTQLILFFFFNDTATTEIYTLSLHDALPISGEGGRRTVRGRAQRAVPRSWRELPRGDRKSTRLNSSHSQISYAVFCLKKKKKESILTTLHPPRQYSLP